MRMHISVHPVKLPYHGVLIERPCIHCNTVDIHFEGNCNSGPCTAITKQCSYSGAGWNGILCDLTEDQHPGWRFHKFQSRQCGDQRYVTTRYSGTHGHDYSHDHKWLAHEYFPADIVWLDNEHSTNDSDRAQEGFMRILEKVKEIGWPEMYTCDLFWDYKRLAGLSPNYPAPPPRFVWAVRSTGCDLFSPEQGIFPGYGERATRYFAYDGKTHGPLGDFVETNQDTARTLLSIWRAEELHPVQEIDAQQEQRDAALLGADAPEKVFPWEPLR